VIQLEAQMAARGKPLTFTTEEITELLNTQYGYEDTFPLLALLFPHVNTRNLHHIDHVYPRSLLSTAKLKKAKGLSAEALELAVWHRDRLANLQLLEGPENIAKKDRDPAAWAKDTYSEAAYLNYLELNALPELPAAVLEFNDWCERRYELLGKRLATLLDADWSMANAYEEDADDRLEAE
jgi:hypothetical protein